MSIDQTLSVAVAGFEKAVTHLEDEFSRLQIGRASSGLVENISVEMYGSSQPIKAIASVVVPEPRTIQIQPWDKATLSAIEKAILASGLGLNPINDGILVRINIPALTEERRADLTKVVKKYAEEAKIVIRNARQDAHNSFKKLKSDGDITEDDVHSGDKRLQDKVDEYNRKIDELSSAKEKDIMTI